MESFEAFRTRLQVEKPDESNLGTNYLRKLYHDEYGVWPGWEGATSSHSLKMRMAASKEFSLGALTRIAGLLSTFGWLSVVSGVILFVVGLVTLESYDGLGATGLFYGLGLILFGLLVVGNGLLLRVLAQIEINTAKTNLLLEKSADG